MLSTIIQNTFPISQKSIKAIEELLTLETCNAKDTIIKQGTFNHKEYFLLEGIVRSFTLNPEGAEVTLAFFTSSSTLTPNVARIKEGKSLVHFQAISNCKLASISIEAFEQLRRDNEEVRNFAFSVLQQELLRKTNKELGLASLSASDRLRQFRLDYPGLENEIPHSYIASYLGITTISLSRLRGQIRY
tara:strand:- start:168 stop:734 length:567 start_codon:yes stop_codon:yes gene_type:complete